MSAATSYTAEQIIAKAQECYELGLIDKTRLEGVVRQAETEPGYDGILDLPFDWEVENELALRRHAAREARRLARPRFLRWLP